MGKADLHIHTRYSDGWMTPEELVDYVLTETDLNVIAITDHDTIAGAIAARNYLTRTSNCRNLDIIVGSEITTREGHVIGLFLNDDIPSEKSALDTIIAIHKQEGLAIAAHPYSFLLRSLGMHGVGNKIITLPFDAVETRNAAPTELITNYITSIINSVNQNCPTIAGSDAHHLITVGKTYTVFNGHSAGDLRESIKIREVFSHGRVVGPILATRILIQQMSHVVRV